MINTKKGLSDIVTNVLIILLVLVAVGIIWAFVRPTINQGAGQLQGSGDCLTVDVHSVSCVRNTDGSFNLTYKREPGQGNVQEVKFLLKDGSGNTVINSTSAANTLPQPLETKTLTRVFFPGIGSSPTFDVAVVVKTDDPAGRICPERNAAVNCA